MHCEPIRPNGVNVDADGAERAVNVGARYSWLNSRNSARVAKTLDEDAIERHKRKFIEPAAMLYAIQKVYGDQAKASVQDDRATKDSVSMHTRSITLQSYGFPSHVTARKTRYRQTHGQHCSSCS
ncbi:MAG TPA: hypothetical protein DCQ94_10690 [Nitrospira sp.]|nr:hypothetical protein [Nitrospira sp.]